MVRYHRYGRLHLPFHILPTDVPRDVEICGVIVGTKEAKMKWVAEELVLLPNLSDDPTSTYHFEVTGDDAKNTVALFHSHPVGSSPKPSKKDYNESRRLHVPSVIVTPERYGTVHNGAKTLGHFKY